MTAGTEPTAPMDRRQRRTARTRADIEAAALRLFRDQGFDATPVEQIADEADVATRTFFRHFRSKEAVLFGDPTRETEHMRALLAERPESEHPMRSLIAAMLNAADRMEPEREQHRMRAELLDALAATGDYELHLLRQRWVQDVTSLVGDRLGTDGTDPRPGAWSMTLISCFASAMHAWLVRTDGTPLRTILTEVLDQTAGGLAVATEEVGPPELTGAS